MLRLPLATNGNGCAGSSAIGVNTGKISRWKKPRSQACWSAGSRSGCGKTTPSFSSAGRSISFQHSIEIGHLLARDAVDRGERLGGRHAVGLARGDPRLRLLAQTGDADLDELGEIRVHDRQEFHAFEQRVAGVLRFLENAAVEGEPRELRG